MSKYEVRIEGRDPRGRPVFTVVEMVLTTYQLTAIKALSDLSFEKSKHEVFPVVLPPRLIDGAVR